MFVLLYFALTLFTSATLLFLVQPMIGKMFLPLLGGTPAVWNTCMVFFQAVLLLGYAYTHFVSTRLSRRSQLILQTLLLAAPLLVLPFSLGAWTPPGDTNPIVPLLWELTIVVGVPFFVVSTTAPLLQKWFTFTGHPASADPYFLYGASNFGSLLALALYPLAMEPTFALLDQTYVWTACYGVFALLVLGSVAMLWKKSAEPVGPAPEPLTPQLATAPQTAIQRPKIHKPSITAMLAERVTWVRRLRSHSWGRRLWPVRTSRTTNSSWSSRPFPSARTRSSPSSSSTRRPASQCLMR